MPTLVIHRTDSPVSPLAWGRYLADNIEGARLVELPGGDVAPYWEYPELTLDAIHEFMTGITRQEPSMRQLATVLFTDIVDSTARAESLGDRRWLSLLDLHDTLSREVIEDHLGHLIKNTGDGHLATFEGPGRAIRAATALREELSRAQIAIRAGIHTGEIEVRLNDVSGLAVHLTARIMAVANAGEIMVSRTVRDLVVGSTIQFRDRGSHSLKGIEGEWQLYALDSITSASGRTYRHSSSGVSSQHQ